MSNGKVVWPHQELGKELSNWGRWGADDEIGTLNFITPEKIAQAARLVSRGAIFDLGMAYDKDGPFPPGSFRSNPVHLMTHLPSDLSAKMDQRANTSWDGIISADDMVIMSLQSATQWDSLAHIGYNGFFYNNVPELAVNSWVGASKNSFAKSANRLVSRGVLLDVARVKGVDRLEASYEVTTADLLAAEERQGVRVASGDILLVRTGWHKWFAEGNREAYMGPEAGLGFETARFLYEREVAALAVDNWACEVWPSPIEGAAIPFHEVTTRDMGLLLGEMFDLEALSEDCEADGQWTFMFSGAGLKITGSTGSPLTPLAIK